MSDFLKDTQNHKRESTQMRKCTNDKTPKTSKPQAPRECRLHVQIRQDLVDKLLNEVFSRKRDPNIRNRDASQRAIIEEALEEYFIKSGI
jgi:hypothetical protein